MVNKVTLIGNLGNDPEVRHLENGAMVARVSLATNERYQDKAGEWQTLTEWHNVIMWRDLAERAEKGLKKGMLLYVEGKITYRKYQDKDGQERSVTDIVASTFRMLEKREGSGNYNESARFPNEDYAPPARGGGNTTAAANATSTPATATEAPTTSGGDDLPF